MPINGPLLPPSQGGTVNGLGGQDPLTLGNFRQYQASSAIDAAAAFKQLLQQQSGDQNIQGMKGTQATQQIAATGAENRATIPVQTQADLSKILATGQETQQNTALGGAYSLAGADLSGKYALAGQDVAGKYGLAEAQTQTLPGLIKTAMDVQKYNSLFPYVTGILGQVAPLLSNISGYIGGGGAGGFSPSLGGGSLTTPQGVNTSAGQIQVPNQVISPGQAAAMMNANTGQGNAAALGQAGDVGAPQGSPLQQQLLSQMAASNSANLNNATTQFLGQLAPANAQQALSAAQLQELARSNLAQQQLGFGGVPIKRLGGMADMITGLTQNLMK